MRLAYCFTAVVFAGSISYDVANNPVWEWLLDIAIAVFSLFKATEPAIHKAK